MSDEYTVVRWDREETPEAAELKEALESDGYSVFQWSDGPGAVYSSHSHGDDQSHCIISGELELDVEGYGKVVLRAGDRDVMPAGTVHAARVIGGEPVHYLIGTKR